MRRISASWKNFTASRQPMEMGNPIIFFLENVRDFCSRKFPQNIENPREIIIIIIIIIARRESNLGHRIEAGPPSTHIRSARVATFLSDDFLSRTPLVGSDFWWVWGLAGWENQKCPTKIKNPCYTLWVAHGQGGGVTTEIILVDGLNPNQVVIFGSNSVTE